MIYLSTPVYNVGTSVVDWVEYTYTHNTVQQFVSRAVRAGYPVVCPWLYFSGLDEDIYYSSEDWIKYVIPFLLTAEKLWVLTLPEYQKSVRVASEIAVAKDLAMDIHYVNQYAALYRTDGDNKDRLYAG